ncbi:BadM/Rrf2 family transcriptional regulator [Thiogranum longum]|uniref:BadM/Rrf2 family transcriptional regulator n=1 Tax=Thiogranum longum TaxID=1537524 RepID=A0A4R1HB38_9GAMM|nr:Rrf2 family transcriptional regulator [Thiogranum longum]TCK19174.1 BadM/Rrf2 family transcriptional regulator [Thiogranum longum]
MKLSTKGRHAITAMMELALRDSQGPVTLADISVEQSISVSYLEQLFARLRNHGLVTGMRGPGGGYCLRRPASEITIAEILSAVDDAMPARRERIPGEEWPQSVIMWNQLSARIYDYLNGLTLAEAVNQKEDSKDDEQGNVGFGSGFQQTAA